MGGSPIRENSSGHNRIYNIFPARGAKILAHFSRGCGDPLRGTIFKSNSRVGD